MTSRFVIRTSRPVKGLVAVARAVAMGSHGTSGAVVNPNPSTGYRSLDRNEGQVHPGEGGA